MKPLITVQKQGLFCEAGGFYIDPWQPVEKALITHAHSDHARTGSKHYWASEKCLPLLFHRIGDYEEAASPLDPPLRKLNATGVKYGGKFKLGDTWVSFHSAGHILGSSQIRVEHKGEVWVASGDYKRTFDPSCDPFEVVECNTFISEATFAYPIYSWESGEKTAEKIYQWWQSDLERPSLVFCYALGKAQRILAELMNFTDQKVYLHGAMDTLTDIYRNSGVKMLPTELVSQVDKKENLKGQLILAPPSAHRSSWMKRFRDPQTAFASGWMQIRGARRRQNYEKGFVLSDHADWNELNQTIAETKATTVYLTHGRTDILARYLEEKNIQVRLFNTEYGDEVDLG